jgi:hypothetical protein
MEATAYFSTKGCIGGIYAKYPREQFDFELQRFPYWDFLCGSVLFDGKVGQWH